MPMKRKLLLLLLVLCALALCACAPNADVPPDPSVTDADVEAALANLDAFFAALAAGEVEERFQRAQRRKKEAVAHERNKRFGKRRTNV